MKTVLYCFELPAFANFSSRRFSLLRPSLARSTVTVCRNATNRHRGSSESQPAKATGSFITGLVAPKWQPGGIFKPRTIAFNKVFFEGPSLQKIFGLELAKITRRLRAHALNRDQSSCSSCVKVHVTKISQSALSLLTTSDFCYKCCQKNIYILLLVQLGITFLCYFIMKMNKRCRMSKDNCVIIHNANGYF